MARDKLTEYSATASDNTVCGDVNIAENSALPSDLNNYAREIMTHLKNFSDGTDAIDALAVDNLKLDGNTISSTDTNGNVTVDPNGSGEFLVANNHNVGIGDTTTGDVTSDGTAARTYVGIIGTGNRGVLNLGTTGVNGADVGTLAFTNGSNSVASISCDSTSGSQTNGKMNLATSGSVRMTITDSGNVGIGTASPNVELEISGASEMLRLQSTDTNKAWIVGRGASADRWLLGTVASNDSVTLQATSSTGELLFKTGGTNERMRIESGGKIKVATTSDAGATVTIKHTGAGDGLGIWNANGTSGYFGQIRFRNNANSGDVGSIVRTNNASVSYNTTSDHRAKENVADMTGAIARVKQLAPKRFNFIADTTDTLVDGFLAHEAQTVVPEAVTGTHNEVDDDGNAVMQGIDQSKLVPLLTGALQEAITKIETLETEMTALKARVTALEA